MKTIISESKLEGCNGEQRMLMYQACIEDDKNNTEATIKLLKKVINIQATVPYAFGLLGSIYYDQALSLDEKYNYDQSRKKYIKTRRKLYKAAIDCFEKSITLKPDAKATMLLLAKACEQLSFVNKALQYYDMYLELNPNNAEVYYRKGLDFEYKKDYLTACSLFSKALSLDNTNLIYKNKIEEIQKILAVMA